MKGVWAGSSLSCQVLIRTRQVGFVRPLVVSWLFGSSLDHLHLLLTYPYSEFVLPLSITPSFWKSRPPSSNGGSGRGGFLELWANCSTWGLRLPPNSWAFNGKIEYEVIGFA